MEYDYPVNGPWTTEPNEMSWAHESGIECHIRRNAVGALCGYIALTSSHPWYGMSYFDIKKQARDLNVHGGLTYSEQGGCGRWVIGFDCAHSCDYCPMDTWFQRDPSSYKGIGYVAVEVNRLAQSADEFKP